MCVCVCVTIFVYQLMVVGGGACASRLKGTREPFRTFRLLLLIAFVKRYSRYQQKDA